MSTAKRDGAPDTEEDHARRAKAIKSSHKSDKDAAGEIKITVKVYPRDNEHEDDSSSDYSDEENSCISNDIEDGQDDDHATFYGYCREHLWLQEIDGRAKVGRDQIASCCVKLVRRDFIREAFWNEMDELCGEAASLALELFDRYGRLNREYIEHEIRKGSGVWGEELDRGNILVIDEIHVTPLWHRQGVGAKLVTAVLDSAQQESGGFLP